MRAISTIYLYLLEPIELTFLKDFNHMPWCFSRATCQQVLSIQIRLLSVPIVKDRLADSAKIFFNI